MDHRIDIPLSHYVIIESVKLNIKCLECNRTFGKTIYKDNKNDFILTKGWEICVDCTSDKMNKEVEKVI